MNAGTARCSTRLPLLILLLSLTSPCNRLWSAQTDPLVGNWRFVPERSRFAGTAPKDIELRFVVENGQLRQESKIILQNGRSRAVDNILQFDGQEHPFELVGETKHSKHTVLWKRIDDHTVEQQVNHDDGKEIGTMRFVISPDGKELTQTQRGQRADGTPSETVIKFVRQ
jgi:hypothetical protein